MLWRNGPTNRGRRLQIENRRDFNKRKHTRHGETKDLLLEVKKGKKQSDGGENSVNGDEKREEEDIDNDKDEDEPLFPLVKQVELCMFEGSDPQGCIAREEIFVLKFRTSKDHKNYVHH